MSLGRRRAAVALCASATLGLLTGCTAASAPPAPSALGADYPGTCLPDHFFWPSDFLDSLPGEGGIGTVVGLRLEYHDDTWMWRVRDAGDGEPGWGGERLLDAATMEPGPETRIELSAAEQRPLQTGAWTAAKQSGEQWPSPLIVEMARVETDGGAAWKVTTCDTETNALTSAVIR